MNLDEFIMHDTGDKGMMTLDEFMRHSLSKIIELAAETTANALSDPSEAAKTPILFFEIEQRLLATWQTEYKRLLAPPEEAPTND